MEKNYHHLTRKQRDVIYRLHQEGKSQNQISRQIGVHRSTISREVKRNSNVHVGYLPDDAQGSAHKRRHRPSSKICRSAELQAIIVQYLSQGWSPEVIAGRLTLEESRHKISHESIYKWIYKEGKALKLSVYLVRRKRKRGTRPCLKAKKSLIPNRVPIENRPPEHALTFGNWEGDTVIFAHNKGAIVTLYERQSKLLLGAKVPQKTAPIVTHAIQNLMKDLPQSALNSITFDNGGEFARHQELHTMLTDQTYFCKPYASWEKGGVENANGILRRDVPKRSKHCDYTDEDITMIIDDINHTPRKSLGFFTPQEQFSALAENQTPVWFPLVELRVALRV